LKEKKEAIDPAERLKLRKEKEQKSNAEVKEGMDKL